MTMRLPVLCFLLFVCSAAPSGAGNDVLPAAAPQGIPTLDELAGDWMPLLGMAQCPSLHNAQSELLVNRDLTSVSWLTSPPFAQAYHSGALHVNGKIAVADRVRGYPYQVLRATKVDDLEVETTTRLAWDARGVLWQMKFTNRGAQPLDVRVQADLCGRIGKYEQGWSWTFLRPGAGRPDHHYFDTEKDRRNVAVENVPPEAYSKQYRAEVVGKRHALLIRDTRTAARTAFAFAQIPQEIRSTGHEGYARWTLRLQPGETRTLQYVMAFGEGDAALLALANRWAEEFPAVYQAAHDGWAERFQEAFTPGNPHFSGHLPTLLTADPALRRVYYTSVLTLLLLHRDNLPVNRRVYLTGGPRMGPTVMFLWDTAMFDSVFALLDPRAMREHLRGFLQMDIERYFARDYFSGAAIGYRYVASYPCLFRLLNTYLNVSGDREFLAEKVGDRTVLEHLDRLAMNWKKYVAPGATLADFGGDPNHFLECVPTYIHAVPGLNAAYVGMLRSMAEIHAMLGHAEQAARYRADADRLAAAVLKELYLPGKGYWCSLYPDGTRVEMRHCLDFQYLGQAMASDLPPPVRGEMLAFLERELLMKNWMRAQSLADPAAARSDRPDHGPLGAYSGWPPETMAALCAMGYFRQAVDFCRRCEAVTHEGAFSQAHEFYGPNARRYDAPVRIADRGYNCREAVCGAGFANVTIRDFFGYRPQLGAATVLFAPAAPRGCAGKLLHVRHGKQLCTITSGDAGLTLQAESPWTLSTADTEVDAGPHGSSTPRQEQHHGRWDRRFPKLDVLRRDGR